MTRRPLIAALLFAALLPATALAAPTLSVNADRTRTTLGNPITLTIRAANDGTREAELQAPPLDDWILVGRSQSTRIDGFRNTRITSITLTLQPQRAGALTIGAFTLDVPGDPLRSAPITVEVEDGGIATPQAPAAPGVAGPGVPGDTTPPPDEIVFLRWEVDAVEVWLGEQIDARLYVYIRQGIGIRDFELGQIDLTGFWTEREDTPNRVRGTDVVVGGLRFERQEVARYSLFPLRAGEVPLPAVTARLLARRQAAFSGGQSRIERAAAVVPITVRPLPEAGRPPNFAGPAVGATRLTAKLDSARVEAGAGAQLSVMTRVDGLIQNVPPVTLPPLPDFTVYPAGDDVRTDRQRGKLLGVRHQRWLLRPKRGGEHTLPALELPWFDPEVGVYRVARTAPLTLTVVGEPGAEPTAETPADDTGPALRDARPVDPDAGPDTGLGLGFVAVLVAAPLLFLVGVLGDHLRRRRHATAGTRAARTAARDAAAELAAIKRGADGRAGYAAIARVIVDYLGRRFATPFNGLTRDATRAVLRARGISDPTIDAIVEELDAADFARFAPAADAAAGLAAAADRAAAAIAALEAEAA